MCSNGMLTKLHGWTRASSAIIWTSIHLSPPKSNLLSAHPSSNEFFGLLSRLLPNTFSFGWSREDNLCYSNWELSLQGNAFWFKECRGYLPKDDDQDVWPIVRKKNWDLYKWYGDKEKDRIHISTCTRIEVAPMFALKSCQHSFLSWSHVNTLFASKPCQHSFLPWSHVNTSFIPQPCHHSSLS